MAKKCWWANPAAWSVPVIQFGEELNCLPDKGVEIFGVLGYLLPCGTPKSLAVCGMAEDALERNMLRGLTGILEASSGRFGVPLAQLLPTAPFNIPRVKVLMKFDVPFAKEFAVRYAGAQVEKLDPNMDGIIEARKRGGGGWKNSDWKPSLDGWLNLDQYANPANWFYYENWLASAILGEMASYTEADRFYCFVPIGTGGTATGLARGLRSRCNVTMIGVMCEEGTEIPGARSESQMKLISQPWRESIDACVKMERDISYLSSLQVEWKEKASPGPSGGMVLAGMYLWLLEHERAGTLDTLRDGKDGKIRIILIFHDNNDLYLIDRFPIIKGDYQNPLTAPLPWKLLEGG